MEALARLLMARNEKAAPPLAANYADLAGPQALGAAQPPMAAAAPPMTAQAPPPAIAPGNQLGVVPPMSPPVNINGPGAGGDPSTPGFWERFNQAIKAQQVPPIYQGAMGQIIGNS